MSGLAAGSIAECMCPTGEGFLSEERYHEVLGELTVAGAIKADLDLRTIGQAV
jgi:hypothetical protein